MSADHRGIPDYLIGQRAEAYYDRFNPYEQDGDETDPRAIHDSKRRDGRWQETCTCSAYKFPHRLGSGRCQNHGGPLDVH